MAELDYAYLAEFAQIADGKINALGASFTHVTPPTLPIGLNVTVAGRVRALEDEPPVTLTLHIKPPDESYDIRFGSQLHRTPAARPYRGRVGLLFTLSFTMPVPLAGLYTFDLLLDDVHVRRLAFDVAAPEGP